MSSQMEVGRGRSGNPRWKPDQNERKRIFFLLTELLRNWYFWELEMSEHGRTVVGQKGARPEESAALAQRRAEVLAGLRLCREPMEEGKQNASRILVCRVGRLRQPKGLSLDGLGIAERNRLPAGPAGEAECEF